MTRFRFATAECMVRFAGTALTGVCWTLALAGAAPSALAEGPQANQPASVVPSEDLRTSMRRLPPLLTLADLAGAVKASPAPGLLPRASDSAGHADQDRNIQLTSATQHVPGAELALRRLPPLTLVPGDQPGRERKFSPAHISEEPPGARPADGVPRVIGRSAAVGGSPVILGPPPLPAPPGSGLSGVGREMLRPRGRLPRDLPNPFVDAVRR